MSFKANDTNDHVVFLYKFAKGNCPMSFGINVARMAGIPKKALELAKAKSDNFNQQLDKIAAKIKGA